MKVDFLRLRNVKSYGEGPDGTGVTVRLRPGLNRIAGRNGHGKSTLIEALGYALFLADPVFEENFQAQTYLLRAGEKTGEIEVGFEHAGAAYRVIRPLGARNPIRDKVVIEADGSLGAEGRAEVDAFLCRLFGVPDAGRLRELFGKLLGVKQGRLAWPFDSKPAEARRHFEPLLDVDVFRKCFDRLKPVSDRFEALAKEQETRLGACEERIRERQGSPDEVLRLTAESARCEEERAGSVVREAAARAACAASEVLEKAVRDAETALGEAKAELAVAEQRKAGAIQAADEARQAARVMAEHAATFEAYEAAERTLASLHEKQREKERLEKEWNRAAAERLEWEGKRESAERQAALLDEQVRSRREAIQIRGGEADAVAARLDGAGAAHERQRTQIEAARQAEGRLERWRNDLARQVTRAKQESEGWKRDFARVQSWDAAQVAQAREEATRLREEWEQAGARLAAARQESETLSRQLTEIGGGRCPFLKEPCRQFDALRAGREREHLETRIVGLTREVAERRERLGVAEARRDALNQEETRVESLRQTVEQQRGLWQAELAQAAPPEVVLDVAALQEILREESPASPWSSRHPHASSAPGTAEEVDGFVRLRAEWSDRVDAFVTRMRMLLATACQDFGQADAERVRQRQQVTSLRDQIRTLDSEARTLVERKAEEVRRGELAAGEVRKRELRLAELEGPRAALAGVADEVAHGQRVKQENSAGHRAYLGARDVAGQLTVREASVQEAERALGGAAEKVVQREGALAVARAAFDPLELAAARQRITEAVAETRGIEARWQGLRLPLERERQRAAELAEARLEEARLRGEQARWCAARKLSEGARRLLKDAAPRVAQRICDRLAARSQRIFHRIHPDPVELAWNAESYSLRIEPGERRFAMLSGGEQTKLALALTLAMIREFSDLRFCIFDEPTYGVDADSRPRLAEAVVEVQAASEFEQILLVSHDDAFEGKIENVVFLRKTAAEGTRVG